MSRQISPAPGQSLIQVRIGGRVYDAKQDSRCLTCMHPARIEIEEKVLQGHSYRSIANQYSETQWTHADGTTVTLPRVAWDSIYRHFKNEHTPVETAALRQIADERARHLSQHYEEQTARIVDGYSFAQQVLTVTHQRLVAGELTPEIRDGLAAAKLMKDIEDAASASPDTEAWAEAMEVYFTTAQQFMPPDAWQAFCSSLARNPILLAIQNRLAGGSDNGDVLEAEIVEHPQKEQS